MKTHLRKPISKLWIYLFKNGSTRMKLKYFIQVNKLYLLEEGTFPKPSDSLLRASNNRVTISSKVEWKRLRNEYNDVILRLRFYRQGSVIIDNKLLDFGPQLEALFKADLLDSNNFRDYVEYNLLVKESANETYYINDEQDTNVIDNHTIRLSKHYNWDFQKLPHCLISGNSGSGKSFQLYEIISEAKKLTNQIYICDAKNDELTLYAKEIFNLGNIYSDESSISKAVKAVENEMNRRFKLRQDSNKILSFKPLFLIIDEYTSLKLTMDKKEYNSLEQSIKNLVLKARSANIHLALAQQRVSSDNINLDVRDNCSLKIGLGNLSVENYRMLFNETITKEKLKHKEIGEGYIYLDGLIKNFKAFNLILG